MIVFLIAVLVLVLGAAVAAVAGRIGSDTMSSPTRTTAFMLPAGRLGSAGIDKVRLDQSLRGYNMAQVDAVLDKLFDEIAELEQQVERAHEEHASARPVTGRPGAEQEQAGEVVQFRHRASEDGHADDRS